VTIIGYRNYLKSMDAVAHLVSDPLLLIHVLASVLALALAPFNLIRRRRDRTHRRLGRAWIATMFASALTSFSIQEPFWAFSWLHALSLWTMVSLALGVVAIRRGRRQAHIAHMVGSYLGLWAAFIWAAAAPARTVAQILAQAPLTATVAGLLAALTAIGAFWVFRTIPTPSPTPVPSRPRT
jgi:uncharacterized membrane protein